MKGKITVQCGLKANSKISGGIQNETDKFSYPVNLREPGKIEIYSIYDKAIKQRK